MFREGEGGVRGAGTGGGIGFFMLGEGGRGSPGGGGRFFMLEEGEKGGGYMLRIA